MDDQFEVVLLAKVALIRCDFRAGARRSHSDNSWIQLWDTLNLDRTTLSAVCLMSLGSFPESKLYPIGAESRGNEETICLGSRWLHLRACA
jgi:hypothetical protein